MADYVSWCVYRLVARADRRSVSGAASAIAASRSARGNVHPRALRFPRQLPQSVFADVENGHGGRPLTEYRMYVDEVGNADLRSSDDPNHRFLSLTGVVLELGHVESVVHPQMEALKSAYFGSHPDDPVILVRSLPLLPRRAA